MDSATENERNAKAVALSVVIPCLDEAETVGGCIRSALDSIERLGVAGEVIVADNGSGDGSRAVALDAGARVVDVGVRGYGSALQGGIAAAQGAFVVMGDADGSYDFGEIPRFLEKHREGYELVQGCRLPAGGGRVAPGAMPFTHRWFGNPMFSLMARVMFGAPIHDVNCGLRGFSAALYQRLEQRCLGMEFAVEMVIKSSLVGARIAEVPITLLPDGRTRHAPHQRTVRDGWRTLRYFLLTSPRWVYLVPGVALIAVGLLGYTLALPGVRLFGARLGLHTLLCATLAILCGYQSLLFGLFAKTFAAVEGLIPPSPALARFYGTVTLERGLMGAAVGLVFGTWMLGVAFAQWRAVGFGDLDPAHTMRWVIPGFCLFALAFQTVLSSFVVGILRTARR